MVQVLCWVWAVEAEMPGWCEGDRGEEVSQSITSGARTGRDREGDQEETERQEENGGEGLRALERVDSCKRRQRSERGRWEVSKEDSSGWGGDMTI